MTHQEQSGDAEEYGRAGGTEHAAYFAELAEELDRQGMPEAERTAFVAEFTTYAADSALSPEEEFGPAVVFAREFAARAEEAPEPGTEADAEEWRWVGDTYVDRTMLAHVGQQGWELVRCDWLGRFVCRRAPRQPMRWEYRREVVRRGEREQHAAELAPDGWEVAGEWLSVVYYKRPLAALAGPQAELTAVPQRPPFRWYLGRTTVLLLAVGVVCLCGGLAVVFLGTGWSSAALLGALVGAVVGGAFGAWSTLRNIRAGRSSEVFGRRRPGAPV